jgi:hypothetical protein
VSLPPPAAPPPATVTVATGRQSQLATLHLPGRTASIAGASIGQALLNRRCSSEGTVGVVVAAPIPTSPRFPATATGGNNNNNNYAGAGGGNGATNTNHNAAAAVNAIAPAAASQDNNNTAQPANSAADNAFRGVVSRPSGNNRTGAGRGRGGGLEPEDSTTAISHAPGAAVAATARGAIAQGEAAAAAAADAAAPTSVAAVNAAFNNPRPTHFATAAAVAAAKPTDSYSSAAANALPPPGEKNHDRNGGGAAASLASHHHHDDHGAGGSLDLGNATVDDDIRQAIDMPAPPLPSANQQQQPQAQQAQQHPVHQPATAAAAPVAMLTPASRMGNGVLLTPGHGLTPLQIQSVVSAALGRAGPLTARPGDSSSSGNRPLVLVGLKRKKPPAPGVGRPPMAPPAQVPRTNMNNNANQGAAGQAQPTASSPGFAPQQADNTLAVEDAVSMVEHGLETADIEVACDAVSKASQGEVEEDFGGIVDDGFIGSGCPSLAGPGVSLASAG